MTTDTFNISSFFQKKNVLDHGSVELIDGMLTDPKLKIVNAARVSFDKESYELSEKDIKLISYLYSHEHFSTFRHSYFTFRIHAPILVMRQWWKYSIGSEWVENENIGEIKLPSTDWNENSLRYSEVSPKFYIPDTIRIQSKNNKQGSDGKLEQLSNGEDPVKFFEQSCMRQYQDYQYLVQSGGAKEQARGLLPQNIYTQCIWTCSLQTIIYFLHQRLKQDAQFEIRQYAMSIKDIIEPIFVPLKLF